jgi:heptosyltransferase II
VSARILIHKRGASGDVVRTTPVLALFPDATVDWLVDERNAPLLAGISARVLTSASLLRSRVPYDLVLSLEEGPRDLEEVYNAVTSRQIIGTYVDKGGAVRYTQSSHTWFDMSLISIYGSRTANRLKFENRASFQQHLFGMFGRRFTGQPYHRIGPPNRPSGDKDQYCILLADKAGPRWPNKEWGYFDECRRALASRWQAAILREQPSLHALAREIGRHDLIIANDSLPMHIALGQGRMVCGLFTCTSPWEIYDYGRLRKLVSPKLRQFYYLPGPSYEARTAIPLEAVISAVETLVSRHTHQYSDSPCLSSVPVPMSA